MLKFGCVVVLSGCASPSLHIKNIQEAKNYNELLELLGSLDCHQSDSIKECFYYTRSFNIFSLERSNQSFRFQIDSRGNITEKKMISTSTQYHLVPIFELPDSFDDFK